MRWLTALLLSLLLVVSVTAAQAAPDDTTTTGDLKAWNAEVPADVAVDMRESGIDIGEQEVVAGDTTRMEIVATAKELAPFRNDEDTTFSLTKGQRQVDRSARMAAAEDEPVFRPWDGPDGLEAEMVSIADANPDLVKLVDIGDTVQGRDIWAIKINKNANQRKDGSRPAVLYNAAQHAREWITPEMSRRLTHYFLDNYDSDPEIRRLVNKNELWFVWVANPDGYQWTHEDPANRLWRKNLRDNNDDGAITTGDGVDLNRNFGYKWGYDNEGSSDNGTSETYRGPGPMSEPETQAMDGLLAAVDFSFMVNYHSAAELLLYGVGWQVDTPTPDDIPMITLAGDDADPAVPGYDPDQSAELYITNGATLGHAQNLYGTLAYTPEMSTCATASNKYPDDEWEAGNCQSGFNFPDDERLVQEEFEANIPFALDIARSAADPSDPVSHLGNVAPELVVDEFDTSYGTQQTVQVTADRELPRVRMGYRVNDGRTRYVRTTEWDGGERYGAENDIYYAWRRGTVPTQEPGDEVTVWFEAGRTTSDPFTYTVADEIGGDVLVVADTDYGHGLSGGVTELLYDDYYADALEANGYTSDLYDVTATGVAPDPLGVLSHYDAVVWYTGDNLATNFAGQLPNGLIVSSRVAHEVPMALRDYINEGGKLLATGKNLGFQEFFGTAYGENADPDTPCTSGNCLLLTNDFDQYWLGGWNHTRRGGLGADQEALDINGLDVPYTGYDWTLDGGDSAMNQGSVGGTNTTGTGTGAWAVTSEVLPVDEFPQFASTGSAEWQGDSGAFEPLTGDYYMASQSDSVTWKRLATTVDLTGAASGSVEANVSYDTEGNWDFVIVEAHTVGQDDWTTLPVAGVTSQATGQSCTSGWQAQLHGFLDHYQTVNADGTCSPTGTTGEWNAVSGTGPGWQTWDIDLSAYAGSEVEVSISYLTDWSTLNTGVFVDDTSVIVDGATVRSTSFESDLGGWTVPGSPPGSADNPQDWIRSEALVLAWATVTTEDSVLQGFGLEGVSTSDERNSVMGRTMDYLLDD